MNKLAIMNKMPRIVNQAGFQLKKHGPEILAVAGTIGVVTSAIMACKATMKVNKVVDETKETIEKIHTATETGITEAGESYSIEDSRKDLTIAYVQTGVKFVKLYGPSVALGVLSLGSLLASNNILRKRNAALAAAYATIDSGFKKYRSRVVERFGDAVDKELKYGIKAQKVDEIVVDEETGKEKKVKKTVDVIDDPNEYSVYARFFDDGCKGWQKDPEANLMFLRIQQRYANDLLRARKYLFLNEVYDMLGIEPSKAGQIVGWVYDPENPNGDNYVDFGIYNIHRAKNREFVNGLERTILLDFNVDGDIWSLMS